MHELSMEGGLMFQSLALKGPLLQRNCERRHECPFIRGVSVRKTGRVAHFAYYAVWETFFQKRTRVLRNRSFRVLGTTYTPRDL